MATKLWVYCHAIMEEQVNQAPMAQQIPTPVGSPMPKQKKGTNKWLFIFLGLLILGGAGIFFFSTSSKNAQPTPTPSFGVLPADDITPNSTPTPSEEPVADRESISIEVLNGTGITGEAGYLQGKLRTLGYTQIETGNASSTDNTDTTVTFGKDLSTTVQNEIKSELEDIYKKVVVKTSSTQKSDVVITTGLRSGQTAKPAASSTPEGTTSPSASPTASPTST